MALAIQHYRIVDSTLKFLLTSISLPGCNLIIVNGADSTTEKLGPFSATMKIYEDGPCNQEAATNGQHRAQDDRCGSADV